MDSKLVRLAKVINGKIVTNDFNLNKVCELQGIFVLNINELANAVKPVVLPGEEMTAQIIKDGKEAGQGVAYLDDGTMVVVEGGKRFIGETIEVLVTSVLQTTAGRMFCEAETMAESFPELSDAGNRDHRRFGARPADGCPVKTIPGSQRHPGPGADNQGIS